MLMPLGDWAGWVQGVGTVGALWAALWQIGLERDKRRVVEDRERERERRLQAGQVSAWLDDDTSLRIALMNSSHLPVHMAVTSLVLIQGAGPKRGEDVPGDYRMIASTLPPGRWILKFSPAVSPAGTFRVAGVEIAFTDSTGNHWIRRADGSLEEINQGPITHYKLLLPLAFVAPEPMD